MKPEFTAADAAAMDTRVQEAYNKAAAREMPAHVKRVFERLRDTSAAAQATYAAGSKATEAEARSATGEFMSATADVRDLAQTDRVAREVFIDMSEEVNKATAKFRKGIGL